VMGNTYAGGQEAEEPAAPPPDEVIPSETVNSPLVPPELPPEQPEACGRGGQPPDGPTRTAGQDRPGSRRVRDGTGQGRLGGEFSTIEHDCIRPIIISPTRCSSF
jgi:hypothetical protein